jgi:hypothetical protein
VVSGYNDRLGRVMINDPRRGANVAMSYKDFQAIWDNPAIGSLIIFGDKYTRLIFEISPE